MAEKQNNEGAIIAYFKMIQNVITRMAQNSFLIKAWSITIIAGILVLTLTILNYMIFIVLLVIISMFWCLDSYYLRLERLYRRLYDSKVGEYNNKSEGNIMILFDMNYKNFIKFEHGVLRIMFSKSELLFYMPLIGTLIFFFCYSLIVCIYFT